MARRRKTASKRPRRQAVNPQVPNPQPVAVKRAAGNARQARVAADRRIDAARRALRTGRSTRSTGNRFIFPTNGTGRTAMQARRDEVSSQMRKNWLSDDLLPNPLSNEAKSVQRTHGPRGIENPGAHCYWNAALQAFMHMPQFLHWIREHVQSNNCAAQPCVRCHMKSFVEEYWGPHGPRGRPIKADSLSLQGIKEAAFVGGAFDRDQQEDSSEAMEWLYSQLSEFENQIRTEQYDALFRIHNIPFEICQTCGTTSEAVPDTNTGLMVNVRDHHNTVDEAIQEYFENDLGSEPSLCHSDVCNGADVIKDRLWVLRATPRVLRVTLKIFDYDMILQHAVEKNFHTLAIGEELDLTQYQECKAVPLKYNLSAVVLHLGDTAQGGHYVSSVRSEGQTPFYNIDGVDVNTILRAEFSANPQHPPQCSSGFTAYVLTYIRDEAPLDRFIQATKRPVTSNLKIDRG